MYDYGNKLIKSMLSFYRAYFILLKKQITFLFIVSRISLKEQFKAYKPSFKQLLQCGNIYITLVYK